MSFIPSTNITTNNEKNAKLLPPDQSTRYNIQVGWKTVNVYYRTNGDYYVLYSDLVSGMDPNHTMTWGCGNLDLDPNIPGWNCSVTRTWFYASGSEGCEYIFIHSLGIPDPIHPIVRHTIDIKVKDDQGDESNWGAITFIIHYTSTPGVGEPMAPCTIY